MKGEVEELRRRLHEAQEREVNSEQRAQDLEEEHEAAKVKFSDLQEQKAMISREASELREQCNDYIKEIERLNGACELNVYRAVERERKKWEEREARWLKESDRYNNRPDEVVRSRSISECMGIPTSVSSILVNHDTSMASTSPPLSPMVGSTYTTPPSISLCTLSRTNTAVTSRDTTSIAGARPTTGADVQTVPAPSYIPAMGMGSGAVMKGGTWGASSDQLGSARQWTELPTVGATVSSSPSSLYPVNMSWPLTVSEVPSTARVNVLATSFLPSCVPTIGTFSSVPSHTAQSGGHAIGFSGLGRCHTSEAMTNPQSVSICRHRICWDNNCHP